MKRYYIYIFGITCSTLFLSKITAQSTELQGKIIDANLLPIEFATVELLTKIDSSWIAGDISLVDGRYLLNKPNSSELLLRVSKLGYKTKYLQAENHLEIILEEDAILIEGVEVKATKLLYTQKTDRLVINVSNSVAQGISLFEILSKTPNVLFDPQSESFSIQGKENALIYIDDKPQYLDQSALLSLIKNMSTANVEKVEIFTNPPSKHDASGNAGVINIISKTTYSSDLFNHMIFAEQGRRTRIGSSLYYRNNANLIDYYLNYNFSNRNHLRHVQLDRIIQIADQDILLEQVSDRNTKPINHTLQLGVNYDYNPSTQLGFHFKYFDQGHTDQLTDNTSIYSTGILDSIIQLQNLEDLSPRRYIFTTTLNHKFTSHSSLNIDFDIMKLGRQQSNDYANRFLVTAYALEEPNEELQNNQNTDLTIHALRANYEHKISDHLRIDIGSNFTSVPLSYQNDFLDKSDLDQIPFDEFRSDLTFTERIIAAYVDANYDKDGWAMQIGVRGENADGKLFDQFLNRDIKYRYTDLFPSISISKAISDHHQIRLAFGKRIDRPNYLDLSPFRRLISYYTEITGNPNLVPQYTYDYSIGYLYRTHSISVNLNYNRTNNLLSFIPSQNDSTRIELVQRSNIDLRNQVALSFAMPVSLQKKVNGQLNVSFLKTSFDGNQVDPNQRNNIWSYTVNASQTANLMKGLELDLTGQYFSKALYGFIYAEDRWQLNLGLNKKLWKDRLTVQVGVDDIFNQNKFIGHLEYNNLDVRFDNRWESQMLKVSISMQLGGSKSNNQINIHRSQTERAQRRINND